MIGGSGGCGRPQKPDFPPFNMGGPKPSTSSASHVRCVAVDVSNSMDPGEQALQREGYIAGLTSREFLTAVSEGANGKIAVTYFEWAGPTDQKIVLPWRLIDGPESAAAAVASGRS
jgi:hypothetical protein